MMPAVEVVGLTNILQQLSNDKREIKEKGGLLLEKLANEHAQYAQEYAAEDTGEMEGSIEVEKKTQNEIHVVSYSQQGWYNEFGTIHMPVGRTESPLPVQSTSGKRAYRPFFRPAGLRVMINLPRYIQEIFG